MIILYIIFSENGGYLITVASKNAWKSLHRPLLVEKIVIFDCVHAVASKIKYLSKVFNHFFNLFFVIR